MTIECPPSPLLHEVKLSGQGTGGGVVCRLRQEGKLALLHEVKLWTESFQVCARRATMCHVFLLVLTCLPTPLPSSDEWSLLSQAIIDKSDSLRDEVITRSQIKTEPFVRPPPTYMEESRSPASPKKIQPRAEYPSSEFLAICVEPWGNQIQEPTVNLF